MGEEGGWDQVLSAKEDEGIRGRVGLDKLQRAANAISCMNENQLTRLLLNRNCLILNTSLSVTMICSYLQEVPNLVQLF